MAEGQIVLSTANIERLGTEEDDFVLIRERMEDGIFVETYGGDDQIHDASGNSVIYSGEGDDDYRVLDAAEFHGGEAFFDGGAGQDRLDLSKVENSDENETDTRRSSDVLVDLERGTVGDKVLNRNDPTPQETWNLQIISVENVIGTDGTDIVSGSASANVLHGGSGADMLKGRGGGDKLYGGDGRDRVFGGEGNDKVDGGEGRDKLFGQDGHDNLFGGDGRDKLYGGAGDDKLTDGKGTDNMFGGEGADRFVLVADGMIDSNKDFDADADVIDLREWGAASLDSLHFRESGTGMGKLVISHGDEVLTVSSRTEAITQADITEDNLLI